MIREILMYPNKALEKISAPVGPEEFGTPALASLMTDLYDTMHSTGIGVGLAAIQIGVPKRVFAVRIRGGSVCMCNPKFWATDEEKEMGTEGCLSFPGVTALVERYNFIHVVFFDRHGTQIAGDHRYDDARVIQHEADHLEGRMYFDNFQALQREIVLESYKAARKKEALRLSRTGVKPLSRLRARR